MQVRRDEYLGEGEFILGISACSLVSASIQSISIRRVYACFVSYLSEILQIENAVTDSVRVM